MSTPPDEPAVPPDEPRPEAGEPAAEPAEPAGPEPPGPEAAGPGSGSPGSGSGSPGSGSGSPGSGSGSAGSGSGSADETAPLPRAGDDTTVLPSAGQTSPGQTGPAGPTQPAGRDRWTARAGIPPPADVAPERYEDDGGPGWWRPAVLGLVALLLLGMLLTGVWLITKAREVRPGPVPTRSGAPTATQPPTTRPAPSTTGGSSPTPAALVEVPPVVGVDVLIAQDLLDQAGLTYQVIGRVSDRRPGTVVASTPEPGTKVRPRSSVTLFVAVPPPTTARATTPAVPTTPAAR